MLDQFSRHVFRNTAKSFAKDKQAQKLSVEGIRSGMDSNLTSVERHFFYMPLMHSEDSELQALSIEKFAELRNEAEAILGFAKGHASIVERFPHRNLALHRASTLQEESFLVSDENKFGGGS